MFKLKRTAAIAAMGTIGLAGVVVSASPAQALGEACLANNVCYYGNVNFEGTLFDSPDAIANFTAVRDEYQSGAYPNAVNDQVSAIVNGTGQTFCFYEHADYQGAFFTVAAHQSVGNLHATGWGDRISSARGC